MLKNYKNIFLSLGSYVVAIVWFVSVVSVADFFMKTATPVSPTVGSVTNVVFLGIFFVLILVGIFFGYKSNKVRESSWGGNLLMVIGIVGILSYLLLMSGFMGY